MKQQFEYIDWTEDVLLPEVEALKSGKAILGLPEGAAFDLVIADENPDPAPPSNASE